MAVAKVADDTRNHSSGHPSTQLPETVGVNLTEAQDDSDSEIEIEIDYEETDCEEQTSCRNKFNKNQQLSILFEY